MRRVLPVLTLALLWTGSASAQGLLIPTQTDVPPLAMASHEVKINLEDQVAVTHVTQTFRNHTDRPLEATYVFPVPKGASVTKFTMWVDGKEVPGELVEADKARSIYTEIVRRTQDPGLLEYMGNNLLRVRVFPVPADGVQKLSVRYASVAQSDAGLVEYIYPLKGDGKSGRTLEKFTLDATLKSQHPIQSVYSPTHGIKVTRPNDREARVRFESKQETLDKDFQLYYTAADKDVGLTALVHRPDRDADGHFMLLISPRAELSRTQQVARDMVFVLDTSGSMAGKRIVQAKAALKFCLRNLNKKDRFGLIHFATGVTKYTTALAPATESQIERASAWVDRLEAVGSTNIDEALATALAMRPEGDKRNFTVVFFTDGQPTIGECNPEKIVKNVADKNTADTRIFTFGVGDDVNAVLLDQVAEKTRSVSTYVRETEDIEAKVSGLYSKISHPVLTNLKIAVSHDKAWGSEELEPPTFNGRPLWSSVRWSEIYPPQLPDLFHGSQFVVLGRYKGIGNPKVTLTGKVGNETKEFVYKVEFKRETGSDKSFVEDLWARRKVGYLLDQIRVNGENKELKDEVISLAKKYGIATPYTSYLVAPDGATVARPIAVPTPSPTDSPRVQFAPIYVSPQMQWAVPNSVLNGPASAPLPYGAYPAFDGSGPPKKMPGGEIGTSGPTAAPAGAPASTATRPWTEEELEEGLRRFNNGSTPRRGFMDYSGSIAGTGTSFTANAQTGKAGVDLAQKLSELRNQDQVTRATVRQAAGRTCLDLGGVWIDQGFDAKMPVVKIKAQSDAYFRILERQKQMREVFQLGNRVVWVAPSQTALVIDPTEGRDQMSDEEIDRLFTRK